MCTMICLFCDIDLHLKVMGGYIGFSFINHSSNVKTFQIASQQQWMRSFISDIDLAFKVTGSHLEFVFLDDQDSSFSLYELIHLK